jgi:hypothetical protein
MDYPNAAFPVSKLEDVFIETISRRNLGTGKEEISQRVVGKLDGSIFYGDEFSEISNLKLEKAHTFSEEKYDVAYEAVDGQGRKLYIIGDIILSSERNGTESNPINSLDDAIRWYNDI